MSELKEGGGDGDDAASAAHAVAGSAVSVDDVAVIVDANVAALSTADAVSSAAYSCAYVLAHCN